MNCSTSFRLNPNLVLSTLLGSVLLASCAPSEVQLSESTAELNMQLAQSPSAGNASMPAARVPSQPTQAANQAPQVRPKLAKTAEIALIVNSIDDTLRQATQIVRQQMGDVLGLQDDKPDNGTRQTASMKIRVPQDKLEITLDTLAKLGTVQNRQLTAEDVTNQLVDTQARLRNLRQTENSLLTIMQRSGSVGDVLKVAQELSKVRQSIEQIDAQLKNLTNRIAYSTITLRLEAAVSSTTPQQPLGVKIQDTWNNATNSVGDFTTDLLRLGIWLVAYSPYLLLFGGAAVFGYTQLKKRSQQPPTHPSNITLTPKQEK